MIFENENTVSFRQSWLDTAFRCPEEARLNIVAPEMGSSTDEAIIGTGAHHGIEQHILGEVSEKSIGEAVRRYYADPQLHKGELDDFRFTKRESIEEMIDLSVRCAEAWVSDIKPHVPFGADPRPEVQFRVFLFEYRGYKVYLTGTIDLAVGSPVLWDWKTAASDYRQKDKQMWAVQPTAYALAAVLGGVRDDVDYQWPVTFNYGVMVKLKRRCRGQILTVQRTDRHAAWMIRRLKTFIDLALDYGLDRPWPMIDEKNYLCSRKWCDYYDDCRGKYITLDDDLYGYNAV